MFKYFCLNSNQRKEAQEPKNLDTWVKHGFSEFIGSIILSLLLAGLSIVVFKSVPIEDYLIHPVLVSFYAGFIAVGLVLIIFLRWSCDLNPAISLTRMLNGTNTYRYGLFKIGIQFIGGIIAGLIIYMFGSLIKNNDQIINYGINSVKASQNSFLDINNNKILIGSIFIFFGELIATSILLFPIFSKGILNKYRDLFIMLFISFAVFMALHIGSAALNPIRGLAQQIPAIFFGHKVGGFSSNNVLIWSTIAVLLGTSLSPFFYICLQGLSDKLNDRLKKIIEFKNYHKNNMKVF